MYDIVHAYSFSTNNQLSMVGFCLKYDLFQD